MNTYDPQDDIVYLHPGQPSAMDLGPLTSAQHPSPVARQRERIATHTSRADTELGNRRGGAATTPSASSVPRLPVPDLATRLAAVPGLVRTGVSTWDDRQRLPIRALSLENAYSDPDLLRALGEAGADVARRLDADVVVGAETAGIPLAAATSLAADLPFAFVRKPGYQGHETGEPQVRGADVAGRRVLLVDDAVSRGTAVEAFVGQLVRAGADVVGLFVLVDMRDVAESVTPVAATLPTESVSTYLGVLAEATARGSLDPHVRELAVDALVNRWTDEDPRWNLLPQAA